MLIGICHSHVDDLDILEVGPSYFSDGVALYYNVAKVAATLNCFPFTNGKFAV